MPTTYIPIVKKGGDGGGNPSHIVIDPLTRIEGHLRIEARVEGGKVSEAWSSSTMFRGIEPILQGRDPRDAWLFTQRICGVCTTVHAISSVRAVEDALGITIPDNARLVRNLMEAAQYVQDHVIHFYHLHALDWVDVVNALSADPAATSDLAHSISPWPNSSPEYFASVKARLQTFIEGGQLSLFANGYWGHPAYTLPAEGNLLAVAHYLEALDWQRDFIRFHALLGGKNPHPQTYLVGGMAIPVNPNNTHAINPQVISQLRALVSMGNDFVTQVYIPDLKLVASLYRDWFNYGAGVGNFLTYGDFPSSGNDPETYWLPRGAIFDRNLADPAQPVDQQAIQEYITRSWYSYAAGDGTGLHPSAGETLANYTGPQPPYDNLLLEGKYSWLKAPRYNESPMEVGPLARMLVAYVNGHTQVRVLVDEVLAALDLQPQDLISTLGRVAARGIETKLVVDQLPTWIDELESNMNNGNLDIHDNTFWDPATWPASVSGWGTTEAPRGALGHWINIHNGKIENYQTVVATTWNGSPRDVNGLPGPFEAALVGTPVADPARPVEILRTIHSFDPCMACSVHLVDERGEKLGIGITVQ